MNEKLQQGGERPARPPERQSGGRSTWRRGSAPRACGEDKPDLG